MDDAELAGLAAAGDRPAWAEIYDRYADRLHDYCWSILRDRHEAEDTLHDAFVTAAAKIGQLRDPALLRPWLYAICRNHALGRVRRRGREVPSEDVAEMTSDRPAPDGRSEHEVEELRRLVWDAAGGLAPRDRSVLELHLRHGMEGRQLAEALGTNPHHATVLLARVRENVERSLGALLVGRTGRRDCAELDALLAGWTGELSPLLRKRVARHIDRCDVCTQRRRRAVSPLALLSGVPLLPAPEYLRARVLADVAAVAPAPASGDAQAGAQDGAQDDGSGGGPGDGSGGGGSSGPSGSGGGSGHPGALARGGRAARRMIGDGRVAVVVGAAGLALLALLGAVLVSAAGDDRRTDTAAESTGASTAASVARAGTPTDATVTGPSDGEPLGGGAGTAGPGEGGTQGGASTATPATPAALEVLTRSVDLGATATEGTLRFRNSGGQSLTWSVTSDQPTVTMHPVAGTLPPGDTVSITVRLDRDALTEGPFAARLRLAAAGGAAVPVTAVQERPPVISGLATTSAWLVPLSSCDRARATAVVTDDTAVVVTLYWGRTGGLATPVAMSGTGGNYSARIGPITTTGDIRWWVTARDSRGNTSRGPESVLPVHAVGKPCP